MKLSLSIVVAFCLTLLQSRALTFEELHTASNLTPQNFSSYFSDFRFFFRSDVQSPNDFLASRSGDCDDFSTLAASELAARGYTPRLVSVRMKKVVHVICYVEEAKGYLDYNMRAKGGLVPCGSDISQIAASVAKSFKNSNWTSASEFTYSNGMKRLVKTTSQKDVLTASVSR